MFLIIGFYLFLCLSHDPVCILVSICETCLSNKWTRKKKRKSLKFKAFLDVMMRTQTIAFTGTFTARYCTQTHSHSQTAFISSSALRLIMCKQTHSRLSTYEAPSSHTCTQEYIQEHGCISPVCPGTRVRPWRGSGACCGSP